MTKRTKSQFAFPVTKLTRGEYCSMCLQCGFDALDDDACLDLFAFYRADQHGTGPATKIAYQRGYTIANPSEIVSAKVNQVRTKLFP